MISIQVKPAPPFAFTAGPDRSICNGQTLTLTASNGFINYHWYPDYKSTSINNAKNSVCPNVNTSYIVTAEKWVGCVMSNTVSITVKPIPIVRLGPDTSFCKGESHYSSGSRRLQ